MGKTILTPGQQKILEFVSQDPFVTKTFFMTGGTALAEFYFRHRISEDLDFFSELEFDSRSLMAAVSRMSDMVKAAKVEQQSLTGQEVFYLYFGGTSIVKIDFAYFPFQHIGKFKKFHNLKVSSIEDIAVNKVHAITSRKRARDYVDLYYCLRHIKWSPKDMRNMYKLKFDVDLPIEQLTTSFTNVVDATDNPLFTKGIDIEEIKGYFLGLVKDLKKELLN